MDLRIENLGGNCPVQAEGTIDGNPFYFRARGQHWRLTVAPPGEDPVDEARALLSAWAWHGEPHDVFASGWMETAEAEAIIRRVAGLWESGLRGELQLDPDPVVDGARMACEIRSLELFMNGGKDLKPHFARDYERLGRHVESLTPEQARRFEELRDAEVAKLDAHHAECRRP